MTPAIHSAAPPPDEPAQDVGPVEPENSTTKDVAADHAVWAPYWSRTRERHS
jgi:hypothetical protein